MSQEDWAPPGAPANVPTRSPSAERRLTTPGPLKVDRTSRLAPRTPTELGDAAFAFLRRHAREVVTTSALFVIPFALVNAFLQRSVLGGTSFFDAFSGSDPSLLLEDQAGSDSTLQVVAFVGPSVALVYVAAAMAQLVAAEHTGREVDGVAAFVHVVKLSPALLVSWIAVHVLEFLGIILLVVPGVLALIAYMVVAPVISFEDAGPFAAMKRSARLTGRRRGPVLGVIAMSLFVESVVESGLGVIPLLLADALGVDAGWIVFGVGTAAVSLITTPFVALVSVQLYLDLRVRTEALDIEMRIPELFDET